MMGTSPLTELDPRQQRSRAALHDALERLIQNKPVRQITISALAQEAEVGRPAFYRLYDDINALLADRLSTDLEEQLRVVRAVWKRHGPGVETLRAASSFSLRAVADRPKLYIAILDGSGGTNAVTMFRAQVSRLMDYLPTPRTATYDVPHHLRLGLVASAISGFLLAWIEAGLDPEPDSAAELMDRLLASAMR